MSTTYNLTKWPVTSLSAKVNIAHASVNVRVKGKSVGTLVIGAEDFLEFLYIFRGEEVVTRSAGPNNTMVLTKTKKIPPYICLISEYGDITSMGELEEEVEKYNQNNQNK